MHLVIHFSWKELSEVEIYMDLWAVVNGLASWSGIGREKIRCERRRSVLEVCEWISGKGHKVSFINNNNGSTYNGRGTKW